jgi:hypothetical protein
MGVPVLHNYYASCTPYTQSTNVFRLRLSRGWTIFAGIWHGCLNPAWVAGGLDLRTTFARVPAAPNDVIACGVHTSVNPAGTSKDLAPSTRNQFEFCVRFCVGQLGGD